MKVKRSLSRLVGWKATSLDGEPILAAKGMVVGVFSFRRKETEVALLFCATKGMEGPVCSFRSSDLAIDLSILTYSCSKMSVGCLYL